MSNLRWFLVAVCIWTAAALALFFSLGCVSAGYRGLVPGKDVHMKNFRQEITTPWGHTVLTADEFDTTVKPGAP